jgi:8-oxo-dGTP pyrophosphatase MutT (NUDIX family)
MSLTPWKILESSYLRPKFRQDKCELENGKILDAVVLEFRTWANVLAITKDQKVVLVRQYRHGTKEVCVEFPGGIVEKDEDPLEGAKRELLEETGYTAANIIEVGRVYPNPAMQSNELVCYLATGAEKVSAQNLDEGEAIEVDLMPLDELVALAKSGKFPNALQLAVLFHALVYMNRIA